MTDANNEILSLAKKLISEPSTADNADAKNRCLDLVANIFDESFVKETYQYQQDKILIIKNTSDKIVDIAIACHLDVVSAEARNFIPQETEDQLIGRGAIDMKGQTAAAAIAIRDAIAAGLPLKLALILTTDEETSGASTKWLNDQKLITPAFVLIPDGGGESSVVLTQKGFWQIKLTVRGKSAHACYPWMAENPITTGMQIFNDLLKNFPTPKNEDDWRTSVALTKIESGKSLNQIPALAELYFDIRFITEDDRANILKIIQNEYGNNIQVDEVGYNGIFMTDKNTPYLEDLKNTITAVTKQTAVFKGECGTSDAIFYSEHQIPAALFRPLGAGLHQEHEWVDKQSLFNFYQILQNFFIKIAGQ